MYRIIHDGLLLAIGDNIGSMPKGSVFLDKPSDMLQYATMYYNEGHVMQAHIHKVRNRQAKCKTLEFIIVFNGKVRVDYYDLKKKKIAERVMKSGDFVMMYDGGHGFEVLKDGTKMIEVKLGDFISTEADKEKF